MVYQGPAELPGFSGTAFLLADPARAVMLTALLDGRALPAGELAYAARVTAQTASSHLAKLLAGGLVALEIEGRHRYYRLAGAHVAQAIEHLAAIRPETQIRRRALSPEAQRLRFCRSCYDHLAGQVGVALTRALESREYLRPAEKKLLEVTPAGSQWLAQPRRRPPRHQAVARRAGPAVPRLDGAATPCRRSAGRRADDCALCLRLVTPQP